MNASPAQEMYSSTETAPPVSSPYLLVSAVCSLEEADPKLSEKHKSADLTALKRREEGGLSHTKRHSP